MHQADKDCLERAALREPPGATAWGRFLIKLMGVLMPPARIPPADVEIVVGDEGLALGEYGIPGRVIHTPGHSPGSVSVLLETGDAFVGDLAMNQFPMRLGPGLPIFADDIQKVKESWRHLLDEGAETVYPAHGKPFPADVIQRALA